jgi:hypothetical protein
MTSEPVTAPGVVVVLVGGVALCELETARVSGPVSCERRLITGIRGHVTLVGGMQTRLRTLISSGAGALASVRGCVIAR